MKEFYTDDLQTKLPPGAVFSAKPLNCSVTAYKSGKVLFQGANYEDEASIWEKFANETVETKNKHNASNKQERNTAQYGQLSLLGSDEVGTGDYFGPITVVAAFVAKENFSTLSKLGVKDSKGMKDDQICKIAKDLIQTIPYSLLVLPNEKYNSLQAKGMNQGKMKAILHNKALLHLKKKIGTTPYDGILIDQFVERDTYYRYIADQKEVVQEKNVFFETKAESVHLSVAAASIIARYAFVKEMDKLSEKVGFEIPKGAGSHVDKAAAKLIQTHGVDSLTQFCKLHFANTEKAKKLL
ncbi:ribonuclease HIII [Anaerobacillus arseniciselenatis]|uniref:Ribonuclease HIII n=2 Tax=Anaerobacillus arseniciselenatis TaxID=85682 RepID=A0A1S2LES2_9BACI|nr:ribonuclease HIII [Anaerobacillus arseniciselenatis]